MPSHKEGRITVRLSHVFESTLQDVRYAVRSFRHSPVFVLFGAERPERLTIVGRIRTGQRSTAEATLGAWSHRMTSQQPDEGKAVGVLLPSVSRWRLAHPACFLPDWSSCASSISRPLVSACWLSSPRPLRRDTSPRAGPRASIRSRRFAATEARKRFIVITLDYGARITGALA